MSRSEVRICSRCREAKPIEDFSLHSAGKGRSKPKRDTYCRPCRSAYGKEHYVANRARYIEQARVQKNRLRLERTRYLLDFFKSNPCVVCGESDPVVLEFDHLGDKLFDIGSGLVQKTWTAILVEIAKCEVVCANCHRRRTARRRGTLRAILSEVD